MAAESKRILIAEDDEFLASLIKNRLEREKFTVSLVKDGGAVVEAIKEFKPDLVLLDIILPGKLGFEILEEVKADQKLNKIPFMVMSNLGQESDIAKAKDLGAVEYFVKARVMIDEMITKLSSFLST